MREDFLSGARSGVNGTFFINGVRYEGPVDLKSLLDGLECSLESEA